VAGVVGAEGVVPDPLPEPLAPSLFGQSARVPVPVPLVRGGWVVEPPEPSDGVVVVLGDADGSGLAADTSAAAPPTRSSADSAAVRTVRRRPELVGVEVAAIGSIAGGGTVAGAGAGTTGGVVHSMESPSVRCLDWWPGTNPDSDAAGVP
jgi:hypothetical protein